jgi:hypothetical protein
MKYSPKCLISAYNIMTGYRFTKQLRYGQSSPTIRCSTDNYHQKPNNRMGTSSFHLLLVI